MKSTVKSANELAQALNLDIEKVQLPIIMALLDAYEQGYLDAIDLISETELGPMVPIPGGMIHPQTLLDVLSMPDAPKVDAGGRPIPEDEQDAHYCERCALGKPCDLLSKVNTDEDAYASFARQTAEPVVIDIDTNRRIFTDLVSDRRVNWDGELYKKKS